MKKILFFSLTILIISFLGSCKKDPLPSIVKGQVTEVGTNIPLENVKVVILEADRPTTFDLLGKTPSFFPVDTILTDKNGNYSYDFGDKFIEVHFYKDKYYSIKESNFIDNETTTVRNAVLIPEAYLQVHLKNVNPVNSLDLINFVTDSHSGGYGPYQGMTVDTTFTLKIRGNMKRSFFYYVWRNQKEEKSIQDSIYIKGGNTLFYEIKY